MDGIFGKRIIVYHKHRGVSIESFLLEWHRTAPETFADVWVNAS